MRNLQIILLIILALTGCKSQSPSESSVMSDTGSSTSTLSDPDSSSSTFSETGSTSPNSCNAEKMRKASDAASKAAWKCSIDASKQAAKLATGGTFTDLAEFTTAALDFKSSIEGLTGFVNLILTWQQTTVAEKYEKIDATVKDSINDKRSAVFQCFNSNRELISKFYNLAKTGQEIANSQIEPELVNKWVSLIGSLMSGSGAIFEAAGRCSEALNGKRSLSFNRALKSWDKITESIGLATTFANCGVSLGNGGYILVNNTMCLATDLSALSDSYEAVDRLEETISHTPVVEQEDSDLLCMRRYGTHLQSLHSAIDFETTAYTCAQYCGNNGRGYNYAKANIEKIYPDPQARETCREVITKTQSDDAIKNCMSGCCSLSTQCVNNSWTKLINNDL